MLPVCPLNRITLGCSLTCPCAAAQIINGLLKFWQFGNSAKEVLFINEMEEVLEYVSPQTVAKVRLRCHHHQYSSLVCTCFVWLRVIG